MDRRGRGVLDALATRWPEYLIEAFCLGAFMVSACLVTAILQYPGSPVRRAIPSDFARQALGGLAMGLTLVALVYSPWGKRSGAHMNPAMTLTWFRLGKVDPRDAIFYALAQTVGALAGVCVSALVLGSVIRDTTVNYAVTVPGPHGIGTAFVAEFAISFGMMLLVLVTSNAPKLASFTGLFAGVTVALYITFESPISGMSMNPARTLGSALPADVFNGFWIYFVAPPLAMFAAAELYTWLRGRSSAACAKLVHASGVRCIFCEYQDRMRHAG